ncbi:unnamed protein product [Danaus chrysippus]|uniref:(African queen) hypothetical protein n=1 Tax=Danaus chrysippus TaxID=151541 RepID=A0A8J2QUV5_9NEOP|nr:unnamed protein product [Danaus chrysippus]
MFSKVVIIALVELIGISFTAFWVNFTSDLQISEGFFAGKDSTIDVYVCRGVHQGLLIPGKLLKFPGIEDTRCDVAYLDKEPKLYQFEMLQGSHLKWTNSSHTLDKAIYGGANADNQPYLICRTKYPNSYDQMLQGSLLKWTNSSHTLDKAIYGGANADNQPYLICRTKYPNCYDQIIVGNLVPPLYNICVAPYRNVTYYNEKFDILVHD